VKVRLRDRVVYGIARLAFAVASRVPQWLGYGAARALGRLWFRLDRRRRGYALTFLRLAYPSAGDRELRRLGSIATGNLFCVPLDMARLTRLLARGGSVREVLDYRLAERQLASMRRPFLGLTAHLGNWEIAAIGVAQWAGGAHGIARVSKNPLLERWILGNRERGGLVIHPRRGGVRDLAKAMAGGTVGLQVVDQNQRLRGVFAPFFGKLASCERAAVTLALRHGYPIVVGAAIRRGGGFAFDLVAEEPFVLTATGDRAADLAAGVRRVNAAIEALVRRAPEQYLWIHDRYRTQPQQSEVDDGDRGGGSKSGRDGDGAGDVDGGEGAADASDGVDEGE
jgi:Kdo2-lipid IVA lauroyltransferase/acyltransferase